MIVKNFTKDNKLYSITPTKKNLHLTYPVIFGDVITVNIAQG